MGKDAITMIRFASLLLPSISVLLALAAESPGQAKLGSWAPWKKSVTIHVQEPGNLPRQAEPVELELRFEGTTGERLGKELRVVDLVTEREVPAQLHAATPEKSGVIARLTFLADLKPKETRAFRIYYDNPQAEKPSYKTDLTTAPVTGFEKIEPPRPFGLTVQNEQVRADFHPRSGQLGKLAFLKGTGKLLTFVGGDLDSKVHWGPDLRNRNRLFDPPRKGLDRGWEYTHYWDPPPQSSVELGPVRFRLKRWGPFTHNKEVFCSVTYTMYARQPYLVVDTEMKTLADYEVEFLRDDEFGFKFGFNQSLWKEKSGKIKGWDLRKLIPIGSVVHGAKVEANGIIELEPDCPWITFYHDETAEAVATIHTQYHNTAVGKVKMDPPMSFIHVNGPAHNYWGRVLAGKLHRLPQAQLPKGCEWRTQSVILFHQYDGKGEPTTLNRYEDLFRHPLKIALDKK